MAVPTAAGLASNLVPSTSFATEIQSMMYAFGDCSSPLLSTATVLEETLHQQMTEILFQASDVATRRSAKALSLEDIIFLMRRSPLKIQRLVKYLTVKDLSVSVQSASSADPAAAIGQQQYSKRVQRVRDFLLPLDGNGMLERALNDELYDEVRMDRLRRLDRLSRNLDEQRYAEFTVARQMNFLGHKLKKPQKFSDWLILRAASWMGDLKVDKLALEIFSYLAYETVGQIVELALLVRRDMEGEDTPVKALNATFPMIHFHAGVSSAAADGTEDNSLQLKKRLKTEPGAATTTIGGTGGAVGVKLTLRPLGPDHIREAVRRLTQRPQAGAWYEKIDSRHQANEGRTPIIVL